jgi:hypothetical protein
MHGHPERSEAESKDPEDVPLKKAPRDPSTSLGMTNCARRQLVYGTKS